MSQENVEIVRRIYAGRVSAPTPFKSCSTRITEWTSLTPHRTSKSSPVSKPPMKPCAPTGDV